MPIHLAPTSRRTFLNALTLGGASLAVAAGRPGVLRAEGAAPGYVALLADTHIDADPETVVREDCRPAANLRAAVADILAQPEPPAAAFVLGDLALKNGRPGDYGTFLALLAPLRERGIPVHLTLGNHDDRTSFRRALKREDEGEVQGRCAAVVEAAGLRVALLDSLDRVDEVPGVLGSSQLDWLARTLDAAPATPTIVLVHHNPSPTPEPAPGTLMDAPALREVLRPRKQVKALVFGHTHQWTRREEDGVHFVNLPAVAYAFDRAQPLGWCRLEPRPDGRGAAIVLRRTGGDPTGGEGRAELAWRGA